jgi:hypothetical protein
MEKELIPLLDNIVGRMTKNLKRRKVVGQTDLVSNIRYETKLQNLEFEIKFVFEKSKQKLFFDKNTKIFQIKDPLFGEKKIFTRDTQKISFLRQADIYKNLQEKYFNEIAVKVAEINAEIAVKLFIEAD